jgi:hypothetical protein
MTGKVQKPGESRTENVCRNSSGNGTYGAKMNGWESGIFHKWVRKLETVFNYLRTGPVFFFFEHSNLIYMSSSNIKVGNFHYA